MIDDRQIEYSLPREFVVDTAYVHSCFMSLFSGMLNWLGDVLYPRIAYKVITTYDKAVEVFKKKQQNIDGQVNTNYLPALTLDPVLDFSNEERAGRFYWMFPNLDTRNRLNVMWKAIKLTDQGAKITPMFTRYQGTVEVTAWLQSIYEYIDYRTKLIQFCGGYQRWIRPECFWTHLILPKDLIEINTVYGKQINWDAINPDIIKLETTATKEYALPFQLDAIWRLDSCTDGSTKMGGDQICEFKCNASFTWECNIPTFIRFEDCPPIERININFGMTPCEAKYPLHMGMKLFRKIDYVYEITKLTKSMCIWNICSKGAKPAITIQDDMCNTYPFQYDNYNHYVCGKLFDITKLNDPEDIKDIESILVIDKYKPEYDPYIRKCRGLISHYDTSRSFELMNIVQGYHISCIYNITNKDLFNAILTLHDKDITFDVLGRMIYLGKHEIKRWQSTDDFSSFIFNNNLLRIIKDRKLKESLKSEYKLPMGRENIKSTLSANPVVLCNTISGVKDQHLYLLPYIINEHCVNDFTVKINDEIISGYKFEEFFLKIDDTITINDGDKIEIYRNSDCTEYNLSLVCDYKISKQDEVDFIKENKLIQIDLSDKRISNFENVYCLSYCGEMIKDRDYVVDEQTKTITFKIHPKRDHYIQIYG